MSDDDRLPFAMVPIEAFYDSRLTLVQLRVLGALLSFRNRSTGLIFPSREAVSSRTGLPITRISTATSALVKLGWLKKDGSGGRACTYTITTPQDITAALTRSMASSATVTESVTVTNPVTVTESVTDTVTESVTDTVTESVTDTVTESVTHNRQENRQENRQGTDKKERRAKSRGSSLDLSVLPADLSADLWRDFMTHRAAIKAPITTQTTLDGIARELEKGRALGYSPDMMIRTVIEESWRGVKADWVANRVAANGAPQPSRGNAPAASPNLARKTNLSELLS